MLASGQKQRVALARALILQPKVIVADEALASLDMSMRSQIINLMLELQEKHGIAYIYVTQHLGMMKHISDGVGDARREIVERGSTAEVLAAPLHELTKRLIASHFGEALTADARRRDGGRFEGHPGKYGVAGHDPRVHPVASSIAANISKALSRRRLASRSLPTCRWCSPAINA